jgi:hypothetical protein
MNWGESAHSDSKPRHMEFLPNEVLELIGIYLDIPSIGRLRRTSTRFTSALDDEIFWRTKFHRDYSVYVEARQHTPSWLKLYRKIYYWQNRFGRQFPGLIREAQWVAQCNGGDWNEIYRDVKNHRLLVHPAIKRLCCELETESRTLTSILDKVVTIKNLHPDLEVQSQRRTSIYYSGIQVNYAVVTISLADDRIACQLFDYLRSNNIDTVNNKFLGEHYLQIYGTYVTQTNGANIWFPWAARSAIYGELPDIRLDYTCN